MRLHALALVRETGKNLRGGHWRMNRRDFLKGTMSIAAVAYLGGLTVACDDEDERLYENIRDYIKR